MSTGITFNQKRFQTKPPDKGSFPLDHDGECKLFMMKYMRCLRENEMQNSSCREQSKDYLQCRMDRNLMKKEDFSKLGFTPEEDLKKS
ncbi:cytochrome c oxidase assembly protein COX19-like [Tubulanus polymorphus]|uniref:cytochrome c oxidase assembly protein COX19-like n=1 Tax=Tubulanus polymorphus TaxID=672921 RepID=UPI003DA410CA